MNIYIGELPHTITEEELQEMFLQFGKVSSLKLIRDKQSGESKGYGFIQMPDNGEADQAIRGLNRTMLNGWEIKVNRVRGTAREKDLSQQEILRV
jgi:RNA recognition motif-containing protein